MTLCISYKISTDDVMPLVDYVAEFVKAHGITTYKPYTASYDFHASIGYVKKDDDETLDRLCDFADYIKKEYTLPQFKTKYLSQFKGVDGKNYIVLNLSEELPYIEVGKDLAKQFECTVPHAHISLGFTDPGVEAVPSEVMEVLSPPTRTFKTTKIQVWDKNYKVVKEARMQKKASLVKEGSMTTAEILDYQHETFQNSTPVYSIPTENIDLNISTPDDTKKIASLISTLTEQVQHNKPDTLSKIARVVSLLEKFVRRI
jgi:hypothetical protein